MSITVEVSLLSGKTAAVEASPDEPVQTLTKRGQIALGVEKGRLLDSFGVVLDGYVSNIQNGDSLMLHVKGLEIQSTGCSFAAILGDGSVVTWGIADSGGDSSAVQDQLKNVQQIQAASRAFAAILGDGSVVAWGRADIGGDTGAVQCQLQSVQQIQASDTAFAAILGNGSVVTWGDAGSGGDSSAAQGQLKNVWQIQASFHSWRWIGCDLGSASLWRRQQCCAGSADSCAANPGLKQRFCCHSWGWIGCDVGSFCYWW